MPRKPNGNPDVFVICPECKRRIGGERIRVKNVDEDIFGADIATFDCPDCKAKNVKSRAFGR